MPQWIWISLGVAVLLYAGLVCALIAAGRRSDARAWAGFIPDCIVLFKRLIGDARVPRSRKILLGVMLIYLAMPFDLVPDFIPIAANSTTRSSLPQSFAPSCVPLAGRPSASTGRVPTQVST